MDRTVQTILVEGLLEEHLCNYFEFGSHEIQEQMFSIFSSGAQASRL